MVEEGETGAELLLRAVDRLLQEQPAELPGAAALSRLAMLLQARERLQAATLTAVRDLDARELYALDGAGSARGWLRAQVTGEDGQLLLARALARRKGVAAALRDGRIAARAAGQLCTALDKVPACVDDDTMVAVLLDGVGRLLTAAEGGTPSRCRRACRRRARAPQRCCSSASRTARPRPRTGWSRRWCCWRAGSHRTCSAPLCARWSTRC